MIKNGYYYPVEIFERLTHLGDDNTIIGDATIGICFGNRTAGKTVGFGIELMKLYEETGQRCMLLTRTKEDKMNGYLEKWWRNKIFCVDDEEGYIQNFLQDHEVAFDKSTLKIDGDDFCYCEPVSMSAAVKNTGNYNYCTNILMDEAVQPGERFLIWQGRSFMERIFEIWQTVARGWKYSVECTHLLFIANTSERDNWIFNDLGINSFVRNDTKFTSQKGICVEIVMNKGAANRVDNSIMGQVMKNSVSGSIYGESAQRNEFRDNRSFICPMGLDFKNLIVQLAVRSHFVGLFKTETGLHAAKISRDSRSKIVCNNIDIHSESIEFDEKSKWENLIYNSHTAGQITYQTQETKGLVLEYCHLI